MIIAVIPKMITVIGLLHKKSKEPSLIRSDLLKLVSIIPPKTNARIKGGIGNPYNLKTVANVAIIIIR